MVTDLSMFDVARHVGRQSLAFSKDWFSEPIKTANNASYSMLDDVLGDADRADQVTRHSVFCDLLLCGRWAMSGFPTVTMGHKTAAAFMATRIKAEDAVEFVRPPWPAFAIRLPTPLLAIDYNGQARDAHLIIATAIDANLVKKDQDTVSPHSDSLRWWFKILANTPVPEGGLDGRLPRTNVVGLWNGISLWNFNAPTEVFASKDGIDGVANHKRWDADQRTDCDERTEDMARALIVAACLHLTANVGSDDTRGFTITERKSKQRAGDDLPPYTNFEIASAIKINLTHGIRDYIAHGGSSPTVQTMVHGHWKRQAHGVGRTLRKLIHVAPYWRGDVDAPISERVK